MTVRELEWIVFDLNGTLLDPAGISAALPAPCDDERTGVGLLDETVQQAMVDTFAGQYRPFTEYLGASVRRRLRLAGFDDVEPHVRAAVAAAGRLPAFPEVAGALEALSAAGLRIATITNSTTESAESGLQAAGIRDYFAVVTGSDHPRAYKPAPEVYRTGLDRIGTEASRACMVAAHSWDLHGAKSVGMRTAWVGRKERVLLDSLSAPDFLGADVFETCQRILG